MAAFTSEEVVSSEKRKGGNGGAPALGMVGINGGNDSATTKVIKSAEQLRVLKDYYSNIDSNPSREKKVELSLKLGLTPRQIQQWFCDQRKKDNRKMKKMEEASSINLLQSNGELPLPHGEMKRKKTIGGGNDKHASDASSGSGSRGTRIILKARATPSVRDEPMAAQWERMPSLGDSEETLGHKRKMASASSATSGSSALKRVRHEDEGLGEEAHQIFRQLRREEALRSASREKEWNNKPSSQDLIHQPKPKQQSPMGVLPSASSSVGYAYCAETGKCFIITRPNPAIGFPPRPVIESQQRHISARTAKKPKIEPTTTEEKIMQRRLELRDIRREKRKEMEKALKECFEMEQKSHFPYEAGMWWSQSRLVERAS